MADFHSIAVESFATTPWILSVIGGLFMILFYLIRQSTLRIPVINVYPNDYFLNKAHAEFISNARGLIRDGIRKFDGPFRVITTLGSRVILPASYTAWVRDCSDLDHKALVVDEYFANYPGFEGIAATQDHTFNTVVKTKLNQNYQVQLLQEHVADALHEAWSENLDWSSINVSQVGSKLIGRMSAAVFVGPAFARNPEWQELVVSYTMNTFNGIRVLRSWPAFLRPVIHWFLPEMRTCRAQVEQARRMLQPMLEDKARAKDNGEKFEDTIEWMVAETSKRGGVKMDLAATQLGFAVSALHTTTELLKQAISDLAAHPEMMQPLREEINTALNEHGWTTAGLFNMQLLDSAIKETQRLKPGVLANLERRTLRDVSLPSGLVIKAGTNVAVDSSLMWDPSIYPNPETWDGYRFLKLHQAGNRTAVLASSSPDHFAFGIGKPICPGRFFAANEVKVALAMIVLNYDIRAAGDVKDRGLLEYGFEMLSNAKAQIEARRRPIE